MTSRRRTPIGRSPEVTVVRRIGAGRSMRTLIANFAPYGLSIFLGRYTGSKRGSDVKVARLQAKTCAASPNLLPGIEVADSNVLSVEKRCNLRTLFNCQPYPVNFDIHQPPGVLSLDKAPTHDHRLPER